MRKPAKTQRLEELEKDFETLLIACLQECVERRRWGLFGQNRHPEAARYLRWDEAAQLKEMALEIRQIRSEWGDTNPSVEKYLQYCARRGENLSGEPKRAAKLLGELTPRSYAKEDSR
jgi:hypothetical protein